MSEQLSLEKRNTRELKIILEVSTQAELLYKDTVALGDHAALAIKNNHRSQLTNLENTAEGALKTSDIFDYVKRQTARSKPAQDWLATNPHDTKPEAFGKLLLTYFEKKLFERCEAICKRLELTNDYEDKLVHQRIYLLLMRKCIRQLVIQYEFRVNIPEDLK